MVRIKRLKVYDRVCERCGTQVLGWQDRYVEVLERSGEEVEAYETIRYFVVEKRGTEECRIERTNKLRDTIVTARQWFKQHTCEGAVSDDSSRTRTEKVG